MAGASYFLFTFSACTTSVRSAELTWCVYFISNARFSSLFFFSAARAFSLALFRHLLLHFSTSICTSFYSILLPLVHDVESFDLNGSIFDFKFIRASFPLKLCAHSFSSIFFCFYWYCYCIENLFVLCGFGRIHLANLGSFVLLVLASPLRVRFCPTRGAFLSSLKWKNNMCWMFIYMIRLLVQIRMFWENVWCMFLENV